MKFDFQPFEEERAAKYFSWSNAHLFHCEAARCAAELTAAEDQGLNVGTDEFDDSDENPMRVKIAQEAWISLIIMSKGTVLALVQSSTSLEEE